MRKWWERRGEEGRGRGGGVEGERGRNGGGEEQKGRSANAKYGYVNEI